jgi:hypothetical protein
MLAQTDLRPVARLDFVGQGSDNPGWYLRYEVAGQPHSERLEIEIGVDAFGAVECAAKHLGCNPELIEFGGPVWPIPLEGLVPAEGTLEFLPDPESTDIDSGHWLRMSDSFPGVEHDARGVARRLVTGLRLHSPVRGKVLNRSELGMGVEVSSPLKIESQSIFKVKSGHDEVGMLGEVRWCHQVESRAWFRMVRPTYRAGIVLIR